MCSGGKHQPTVLYVSNTHPGLRQDVTGNGNNTLTPVASSRCDPAVNDVGRLCAVRRLEVVIDGVILKPGRFQSDKRSAYLRSNSLTLDFRDFRLCLDYSPSANHLVNRSASPTASLPAGGPIGGGFASRRVSRRRGGWAGPFTRPTTS